MSHFSNPAPVGITQAFRGLRLRTHPDADKVSSQIMLTDLDDVVMNDGQHYTGLSLPLTADITVNGAGGLDTGARAAGIWYKILLIGKSSTKVASDLRLMLHRGRNYSLDQSNTTVNTAAILNAAGGTTDVRLGQSFKLTNGGPVPYLDLLLTRTGSPSGRIWVTLEADSAGVPSGTPLATSDKLDASQVSTSQQGIRFVFRSPATLTAATTYWAVIRCDYTASSTNCISVIENSTSVYANGTFATYNGTTWTATGLGDAWFKIYVTLNETADNSSMPSGFDEYCHIGWVFNNSVPSLIPFRAIDRRVLHAVITLVANGQAAGPPLLQDLSFGVPPVPVRAWLAVTNGAAPAYAVVGGVPDGFAGINGALYPGIIQRVYPNDPGGFAQTPNVFVDTETQAVYGNADSGTFYMYTGGYEW